MILAGYGFYLVYSLTKDVAILAQSVEKSMATNLQVVAANMDNVSKSVSNMSTKMDQVSTDMQAIAEQVSAMKPMLADMDKIATYVATLQPMLERMQSLDANVTNMNRSMGVIAGSTDQMRQDLGIMNRAVSPTMGTMRNFMPW